MSHSNVDVLKKLYSDFAIGDLDSVLNVCDESVKFEVPGKNRLSGTYSKSTFSSSFAPKIVELSNGTYTEKLHDIFANDLHGVVLLSASLTKNGTSVEYRTCHIWRFKDGKPVAWYEYPRDLHHFDTVWS